MTDKELKKLNRRELLELLLAQSRNVERLQAEVEDLKAQLASRKLALEDAGSIAEAALKLNHVFESAEAAAAQYLENIQEMTEKQAQIVAETETKCAAMVAETQAKCEQMLSQTAEISQADCVAAPEPKTEE